MAIRPAPEDLSLRQLQYVVAVADTLGFRKAAERCGVSQPTLSAQVAGLEAVLGVRLFERNKRRVRVTRAGEALVERARRVLVGVDDLLTAADGLKGLFAGELRFGVIPTVAPYLLPDVMPALTESYPGVDLSLVEDKTQSVVFGLERGKLDAGIVALEADLGDLEHAEILRDPFVVALPKGHFLAKRKRLSLEDLEEASVLLLDDGHCFRAQGLALCGRAGAREANLRATSLATLVQMVSAGRGLTLLPTLAVPVENRRGQIEVRPFLAPAPGRTISLVWRPSSPHREAMRELASTLRRAAKACSASRSG